MNALRKLTSWILVLAMFLSLLGGGLLSPAAHAAEQQDVYVTGQYVNPLYEDVLSPTLISPPLLSEAVPAADPVYLTTLEEIGAAVREAMEDRNSSPVIYFASQRTIDTEDKLYSFMVDEVLPIAFTHTGVPTEGDYIRWHFQNMGFGLSGKYDGERYLYTLSLTVTYYTTAAQEQTVTNAVNDLLNQLDVDTATEYRKLRAIYDYICANVTYDHDNLEDDSYTLKYTAYAALMDGTAVCQGYALLLYRLALELGVDARLIAGDGGGPHGWNIARINDLYYNLDSTWDEGKTKYNYFLVCPANFKNHIRNAEYETAEFHAAYPMDDEDYDPANDVCTHNYASSITREASCTEAGEAAYICSWCGDSYTEAIAALGHEEVTDEGFAATCTETGLTDGSHCSRCEIVLTEQEIISALGHSEVTDEGFAATCTETGLTDGSHCSRCEIVLTEQEVISALGHSWDEGTVTRQPTETEKGEKTFTCSTCGETRTEEIPALGHEHSYTAVVTAPTCTEAGFTTHTCTCGDSYTSDEVPALGHEEVTDEGYAATCTESGLTDGSHCSRCEIILTKQEVISALGHNWDEGTVTRQPTETEKGEKTFTCSTCGETRTEEVSALGHEHSYTAVVTAPTCTEAGFTTYTCTCGDSYTSDEVPALGHEEVTDEGFAATCTETGLTDGSHCSRCEIVLTEQEVISALGHNWDEGTVTRQPTETEKGEKTFTCNTCGETRTEEIPCLEAETTLVRIFGENRCETAIETAAALKKALNVDRFDAIILASGENFADALAGSYLANAKGAPILLHFGNSTKMNLEFIRSNLSGDGVVYILGGTASIPAAVETALTEAGLKVTRIMGASRFDTNLAILNTAGITDEEILVATGWNFADSLSVSATGLPILMVNSNDNKLTKEQVEFLSKHAKNKVTIIGGFGSVSEELETAIAEIVEGNIERICGENRVATSVAVAEKYFRAPGAAFIAYSLNFPDGLCGGPLACAMGAPLLLINEGKEHLAAAYVDDHGIRSGYVLGGTSVISDASAEAVFG